jgi:glutamate decarboxylase
MIFAGPDTTARVTLRGREDFVEKWRIGELVTVCGVHELHPGRVMPQAGPQWHASLGRRAIAALPEPSTSEPVSLSNASAAAGRTHLCRHAHASSRDRRHRGGRRKGKRGERIMSIHQHSAPTGKSTHGDDGAAVIDQLEALAEAYGNRFLLEPSPDNQLPEHGMRAVDAMRLIGEELVLDGIPQRNLATFVTTWMEPEAQRIIAENLHRNFIDHAEYPQTAEIEQRCIRILASLFHAPGETTGARTQGSSEAIMLGALSLKWKWRQRREAAGKDTSRPNLVFGGDVHVVWEKFCRYFDVEPRIIPLQPDKYTIGPEDVEPHLDENTIGVAAVLGTTFTGHADDIRGINQLLVRLRDGRGLDVPLHVDGASGGFVWPFLYPDSEWDFRLEQVRSINTSGHKYGLVYPGIGWLVFREKSDLAEDLVFYENYLGKTDATFTLNFSTGSSMVLAQYYNFVRYGHDGYSYIMETMQANSRALAERIAGIGDFKLVGDAGEEQLPLVAFQLEGDHDYDEFDVASQLAAERGWMVPAYKLPPNADHVTIMRALVKLTLGHTLATTLADDIAEACETLKKKGGLHELDRKRVKTGTGY